MEEKEAKQDKKAIRGNFGATSYHLPYPQLQRGEKNKCISNARNPFEDIQSEADLKHIAFHHMRGVFISKCVMTGVPMMTIAA